MHLYLEAWYSLFVCLIWCFTKGHNTVNHPQPPLDLETSTLATALPDTVDSIIATVLPGTVKLTRYYNYEHTNLIFVLLITNTVDVLKLQTLFSFCSQIKCGLSMLEFTKCLSV